MDRFLALWRRLAKRYGNKDFMAFELLNEIVEEDVAEAWNDLIIRAVREIRRYAPTTPIIYGGIQWNSARTVRFLRKPEDENIIFTFHFYEPLLFTHQKAYWVAAMDPNKEISYPATMEYYRENSKVLGYQGNVAVNAHSGEMGPKFMEELIADAVDAAKKQVYLYIAVNLESSIEHRLWIRFAGSGMRMRYSANLTSDLRHGLIRKWILVLPGNIINRFYRNS